jgi:hypothetical protein
MRHLTILAALCLGWGALSAEAGTPLDWPQDGDANGPALALHCAAVMTAHGLGYVAATEMAGRPEGLPPGTLPRALLERAGGLDRLGEIRAMAEGWAQHSDSVAATHFFPRLSGEGTPYLADDGRVLMQAVQDCADRFDL